VVLFVSNPAGIAAAAALLESPPDIAGLSPELRADVVVYYAVRPFFVWGGGKGGGWIFCLKGVCLWRRCTRFAL
jgi:hypothetical protein